MRRLTLLAALVAVALVAPAAAQAKPLTDQWSAAESKALVGRSVAHLDTSLLPSSWAMSRQVVAPKLAGPNTTVGAVTASIARNGRFKIKAKAAAGQPLSWNYACNYVALALSKAWESGRWLQGDTASITGYENQPGVPGNGNSFPRAPTWWHCNSIVWNAPFNVGGGFLQVTMEVAGDYDGASNISGVITCERAFDQPGHVTGRYDVSPNGCTTFWGDE